VHTSRRAFLGAGLASLAAFRADRLLAEPQRQVLPSPRFPRRSGSAPQLDMVVGRRPVREGGIRLERVDQDPRIIIHNYGHGGGGITLAPGCAQWIVENCLAGIDRRTPTAVLGAGIVGLTSAAALRRAGFRITVYSDILPGTPRYRDVTSMIAGGQFAPSIVSISGGRLDRLLRASGHHYRALPGSWMVRPKDNYTIHESSDDLGPAVRALGGTPEELSSLPFEGLRRQRGYRYPTLLIEPPIYLSRLHASLLRAEPTPVRFVARTLDQQAVAQLPERLIVNCLGLNGGNVFGLSDVAPKSGLLVRLPAQPDLDYLYSGVGYVFPRSDYLIVGGSGGFPSVTANGEYKKPDDGWSVIDSAREVFRGSCPTDYWWMSGHGRWGSLASCAEAPKPD
jgi:D-amino-acid oxidase